MSGALFLRNVHLSPLRWLLLALSLSVLSTSCGSAPTPLTIGVAADSLEERDEFAGMVGTDVGIYSWFQAWQGQPDFDVRRASAAAERDVIPMLTWEPWDPERGQDQPDYALARVAASDHDDYTASYARQIRRWGGTLALRFAHELNAPIYPWSVGLNGNTEQDALDAWRHVQQVFAAEGADVVWVWSVNVSGEETVPYEPFFPGDDDVDWIGLDGYNGGEALPWGGWRTPEELLGPDVDRLQDLSDRPVMLTEVASAEAGGDKAGWISDLFDFCRDAGVAGLVWFDYAKEADWRVNSSSEAAAAFRRAAGDAELAPSPELPARLR